MNTVASLFELGAKNDGRSLNTSALQRAIDLTHAQGGGFVRIPAGYWLTGTLLLRNHVHLHLDPGAVLLGSPDIGDYPRQPTPAYRSQKDPAGLRALIYAEGATDIGLHGPGEIDGQGASFSFGGCDADGRPRLIQFVSCRAVTVTGLSLRNSGMWMQHYLNCDQVALRDLRIWNHANRNNDMIDIDGSRDVTISGCTGDTDDDGITLKSTGTAPCEDVVITNCTISSRCNAVKLGTESTGGFKNIVITNCVVKPSRAPEGFYGHPEGISAIALEIVDGGSLEGVIVSNLRVAGTRSPIFIRLANRARPHLPELPKPGLGRIRNILLQNILVSDARDVGSSITGLPEALVEDIRLVDVHIENSVGAPATYSEDDFPELADSYPEATMWGPLPAHGFYVRHARGVTFERVVVRAASGEQRPVISGHNASIGGKVVARSSQST